MTTSVREAGTAAPTPAAAELPVYQLQTIGDKLSRLEVEARWHESLNRPTAMVGILQRHGDLGFHACLTPAQARLLAVYLVDCANALDNPAQRVIVDEGEGLGHE